MHQRKPFIRRAIPSTINSQERAYFNIEERAWLERQVKTIGKGKYLLNKKTIRTPIVKEIALRLSIGKNALSAVHSIINYISNPKRIELISTGWETVNKFYNKQTAGDVLSTGRIPTVYNKHGDPLVGCNTIAATLAALLRAAKPSEGKITHVRVVRTISPQGKNSVGKWLGMPHTIVYFRINGRGFIADPFNHGHSFFNTPLIKASGKIIEEEKIGNTIEILKKQGCWKEALDPHDFGLEELKAFIEESHRAGSSLAKDLDLQDFMRRMR